MYLVKTPNIVQRVYNKYIWRLHGHEKSVFLSFDDGPNPHSTPIILDILDEYEAKACFFCLGSHVEEFPLLFEEIKLRGHSIGNHSYSHPSGWNTENSRYYEDVHLGAKITGSQLFRPPFGRIRPGQAKQLSKHYELIMWDVMSGDFDQSLTIDDCFHNVKRKSKSGSIVVLHDNLKAYEKIEILLPMILDYYSEIGYNCVALQHSHLNPSS